MIDDLPLSGEQLQIVVIAMALVASAVAAPVFFGGGEPATNETVKKGTLSTPEPVQTARADTEAPDKLRALPESHTETASGGVEAPTEVSASAGSQTMDVSATTVDGEPALVLDDSRVHEGRWVSVPANWFNESVGGVPQTAYIEHESGESYATPTHVRGDDVAFYVEQFSTNTVTFSGEVVLSGSQAADGTQYQYDINDLDSVSNFDINLTGRTSTETETVSGAALANGDSLDLEIAGTDPATDASVTFSGHEETASATASGTGSGTVSVGGNVNPTDESVQLTGDTSTTTDSVSANGVSPSTSTSLSVGGNLEPTDGSGGDPTLTVTGYGSSSTYNPVNDYGDGTTDDDMSLAIGDGSSDTKHSSEIEITPGSTGDIESLSINVAGTYGDDYNPAVDVYLVSGEADQSLTKDNKITNSWDPSWSTGDQSIPVDNPQSVTAGNTYHLEFVSTNTDNDGTSDTLNLAVDTAPSSVRATKYTGSWYSYQQAVDVDVSIDGQVTDLSASTDDGATATFGNFNDGETKTRTIDLSTASSSLDFSSSAGHEIDYSLDWTERTAVEDPDIDIDGDGYVEASWSGIYKTGESTTTKSVDGLSTGDNSVSTTTAAGPAPSWDLSWTERTAVEDPSIDIDGDDSPDASYSGILPEGETSSKSLPNLDTGSSATISTTTGAVDVEVSMTERTQTVDPAVTVNGNTTTHSGTLADGSKTPLTTDTAWLQSGTNTVDIAVGDGTLSADAPTPQVGFDYSHDASDKISTTTTETEWLEQYNVSKTYASNRSSATLTIPHQKEVLSIKRVEKRVNGGSWSSVDSRNYDLNNTELTVQLGSVVAGDKIEVRTTGSMADVNNGAITVTEPTTTGDPLDSRIRVDSWNSDSYIQVPQTAEYHRIHYVHDATFDASEDVRVLSGGDQRLRIPKASADEQLNVSTIPVEANATSGDVVVTVDDANKTQPVWTAKQGQTDPDTVHYTLINAQDGEKYTLYSQTHGIGRDSGTANSPLTLTDDDSGETLTFLLENSTASSSGGDGGGGTLSRVSTQDPLGNIVPLLGVALAIGALLVIARRDEEVTNAGNNAAEGIESAAASIPVLGPAVGGVLGGLTRGGAQLVRTVLGNQTVAVAVATAIGLAAIQAEIIVLPSGSLVIVATAAVSALSFVALREFDEFSMERWTLIVVSATVVSLQVLSDESLLTAIVNSQVWPILVAGGLYLAYQLIQSIRSPEKTQNIVIEADGGNQK
ncbi:hypothetical protein C437_15431 [Haloarcula vallismortis ATCC 29715]|uniref:Uncharacterized protein n=1 Tax=Haloarcula vallismortis ATCC 29715 TaxID=662477 RepID=M0J1B2_HALVA|nr:hypothetical protein [Haloarcula vallismortis]EMA01824.1 hypothetical protein C437_15431 [Haloarcula vallismortis ATCC 29715]